MSRDLDISNPRQVPSSERDQRPQLSTAQIRRRRARIGWALMIGLFIVLPTVLAAFYYGLIASDRYVSKAQVTVRSSGMNSMPEVDSMLSSLVSSSGSNEAHVVREYILSPQILNRLQDWLNLRENWSQPSIDLISRLDSNASSEDLLEYYRSMVAAGYDTEKQVLNLSVQGYSRDDANALATAIIELSETMVNRMSDKIREDSLEFARNEVQRAEERLQAARVEMKRFQNKHGDLDPVQTASAIGGIMANIESRLAEVRTEISAKSSYMRSDSPAMKALQAQERALETQLERERERLTGADRQSGDENYSGLLVQYEKLRVEEELARKMYAAAQTGLEKARAEAARKQLYLVSFVDPTMPDEATRPERALNVLVAFLVGLAVFAVLSLVGAAIREHARF